MSLHRIRTHPEYVENCFGCKATTLEMNAGDAGHKKTMPAKKWDAELQAYRNARSQGIQPAGTSMKAVQDAVKASENLGKAYDGNTMPPPQRIAADKSYAKKAKEFI
jgi:hypothetical protein